MTDDISAADRLDAALSCAARAWRIVPNYEPRDGRCSCKQGAACEHPGKHPWLTDWPNRATTDFATIQQWLAERPTTNLGLLTGAASGIFALDIDPRHGGDESLALLEGRYGPLPRTVRQQTGGGGEHILFRHPGFRVGNQQGAATLAPGIDVRGDGGQILIDPSRHVSGGVYRWEVEHHPDDVPVADAPAWLLAMLQSSTESRVGPAPPVGDSIPDGARNGTLASLAGSMRRRGMGRDEIVAALLVTNAQRCRPPLPDAEVREIAASIGRYAAEGATSSDDASSPSNARDEPERPRPPILLRASLAEILAIDPVTLQTTYIVAPYIPENGLVILTARPGVGKSKLTVDLCLARAMGAHWLGLPVAPGPALFWSGEQGWKEDYRTVQALCRGRGLSTAAPHFFDVISDPALKFGHPTMLAAVLALATEHTGLLIGIDSMRRAFEGEDISSTVADHFFQTVLLPLRTAGATVLLLAHPPKTSGTQKTIPDENMIRGSGDFAGQIDGFFVLRPVTRTRRDPDTEDVVARLTHPKARRGWVADPRLVTLHVTHDRAPEVAFRFEADAAAGDATQETAGAVQAIALLAEELQRLSRKTVLDALAKAHHYGRPAIEAALARLLDLGVLQGPLAKAERRPGERGHWYVFVKPLPEPATPADAPPPGEDDDDLPF